MAYRPVAMWWLCKQQPLLGNARNIHARNNRRTVFSVVCATAVSRQWLCKHVLVAMVMNATIEQQCFLAGPCRDVISTGESELIESSAQKAVKTEP
jgi:hypothetical protein